VGYLLNNNIAPFMKTLESRISQERINNASSVIDPVFLNSHQYLCESLSEVLETNIYLKLEIQNPVVIQRQRCRIADRKSQR